MTSRVQLGWWAARGEWEMFVRHVEQKWGCTGPYLRFEVELAMRGWLDCDHDLAEAESLLKQFLQSQGLSSSSEAVGSEIDHSRTVKLNHRINAELKEEFSKEAKRMGADSLGVALSRALNAHRTGGRSKRVRDDVETLVTGGTSDGTTSESDESASATQQERGTTAAADESVGGRDESASDSSGTSGGTTAESDENVVVEPHFVMQIAEELPDEFPLKLMKAKIFETVDDRDEVFEAYRDAVANYKNVVMHPHRDDFYITQTRREETTFWCDLNRELRAARLRRLVVWDALEEKKQQHKVDYKDVQELFELRLDAGPSHDYAYTLMEDAAKQDGFTYKKFHGRYQLRVDVHQVKQEIIDDVVEAHDLEERDDLAVDTLITSYTAGSPPQQEVGADD